MDPLESQNSRDARIEQLWRKLDTQNKGRLDVHGLRKGLRKIDHPLKNADDMLHDVVRAVDTNGDGVIQYEEFRKFVEETESELLSLFRSIDRDHDGRIDKTELQTAFKRAGLAVPNSKLSQFFEEVDLNNDGYITFEEWRNFLLFLPTDSKTPPLKAVLSYYTSSVSVNAEGDTSIREETLEGLGTPPSFLQILFGAILNIAAPQRKPPLQPDSSYSKNTLGSNAEDSAEDLGTNGSSQAHLKHDMTTDDDEEASGSPFLADTSLKKSLLTEILPHPGYFAAGGLAGVISRTSTAPLDRLKVYLIANTGSTASKSIDLVKQGEAKEAAKKIGRPLVEATKELWRAGGMRSLFAGNGLNVLKVMPESAIKFGSYEAAKRALAQLEGHGDPQNINSYSQFLAGGAGGVISQLFVYPIDTLKFRMQCETVEGGLHGNALIAATARKMIAQGGIRSSYRGLTMGLVGMFPYSAIDLGTFEFLKGFLTRRAAKRLGCHEEDALPGSFATGCIGAFSGAFGASIVYPINLLRTRLQAQGTVLHPPTYTGVLDVAQKTIKHEGVRGLFKGITPNLLKVVPAVSITYVVYENAKKAMHLRRAIGIQAFSEALYKTWNPRQRHYQGQERITIGLAISGGVDSIALANLCSKWLKSPIKPENASTGLLRFQELRSRISLQGFVVDHGVRKGSDQEALSVAEMLHVQGIPTQVLTIQWPGGSNPAGQPNFESLARKHRFQELGKACRDMGIDSLFLAHHRDDQAETVLMRMIDGHRGVGLTGMESSSGIPECYGIHGVHESGGDGVSSSVPAMYAGPQNKLPFESGGIKVYRPLLSFPKSELKATCEEGGVPWFEDHTNADPTLTRRNAVRHLYAHHPVPVALSKGSILTLSRNIREKSRVRDEKADEWFRACHIHTFNNKAGTLLIAIPYLQSPTTKSDGSSSHDNRRVAALLLRRIIALVSPEEHVQIAALKGSLERVFPDIFGSSMLPEQMTFTVAGVKFDRLPSPAADSVQEQPGRAKTWFISRQPHPAKLSSRPSISIPHQDPGALGEHAWELPWTLYDGRFWIRVKNPSTRPLCLRPLAPADVSQIRNVLEKRKKQNFEKSLRDEAPGSVRWTIPVLVEVGSNDEVKVFSLPTLNLRIDESVCVEWEVRYKEVCM
ncbi:Calcium-binding mitochondrial carrier SAL1 [Phlyctema vagabunda]|uniref:Mitochondrial thiamine pyrophosphate carrier 1 n=1 Tax=Phlyctema vagabunda TaxID=108571 RepID=A0ABR4PCM8_9HELO